MLSPSTIENVVQYLTEFDRQFEEPAELPAEEVRSLVRRLGDILNLSAPVKTFVVVDYTTDGLALRSLYQTASLCLEGPIHG